MNMALRCSIYPLDGWPGKPGLSRCLAQCSSTHVSRTSFCPPWFDRGRRGRRTPEAGSWASRWGRRRRPSQRGSSDSVAGRRRKRMEGEIQRWWRGSWWGCGETSASAPGDAWCWCLPAPSGWSRRSCWRRRPTPWPWWWWCPPAPSASAPDTASHPLWVHHWADQAGQWLALRQSHQAEVPSRLKRRRCWQRRRVRGAKPASCSSSSIVWTANCHWIQVRRYGPDRSFPCCAEIPALADWRLPLTGTSFSFKGRLAGWADLRPGLPIYVKFLHMAPLVICLQYCKWSSLVIYFQAITQHKKCPHNFPFPLFMRIAQWVATIECGSRDYCAFLGFTRW